METSSLALGPASAEGAARTRGLDAPLAMLVTVALFVLLASPTRFFFIPLTYDGDFQSLVPPNLIDLVWLGLFVALFLRSARPAFWVPLVLGGLVLVGAIGLAFSGFPDPEMLVDLFTFNCRLVGGLAIGSLLAGAGIASDLLVTTVVAGSTVVAISTIVLALGRGPTFEFYTQMQRFGGMGLGPNEAAMLFAGSLNVLPFAFRRRPWLLLAAPLLLAALIDTGSRTGVIIAAMGALLWVPVAMKTVRGVNGILLKALLLILSVYVGWLTLGLVREMMGSGLASIAYRLDSTSDSSAMGRFDIYDTLPAYLLGHVGVLLVGVGGSNVAVEGFLNNVLALGTMHTHNLVLQFVTAYGVGGLLLVFLMVRPLLRRGGRFPDDGTRALRWFALTLVAGQMLQYGFFEVKFLLVFTMAVGFVAAATRVRQETPG